jgi:hypothetical protein
VEPDISEDVLPESLKTDAPEELLASIKTQFETNRTNEALLRTVVSPDGLRALALYDPGGSVPTENTFRIDLYGADGMFVRNVLPPNLEGITLAAVAWSPDAQSFAFIGREKPGAQATPTPDDIATAPPGLRSERFADPDAHRRAAHRARARLQNGSDLSLRPRGRQFAPAHDARRFDLSEPRVVAR